jgi:DNA-directed RNA polymerase specialized sigma24 family protein
MEATKRTPETIVSHIRSDCEFQARQRGASIEVLEDLTQEMILRFYSHPNKLELPRRYWGSAIANWLTDHYRTRMNGEIPSEPSICVEVAEYQEPSFSSAEILVQAEDMLSSLREDHREAIEALLEGGSMKAGAEILGLSIPAFKCRVHKGRAKALELFDPSFA